MHSCTNKYYVQVVHGASGRSAQVSDMSASAPLSTTLLLTLAVTSVGAYVALRLRRRRETRQPPPVAQRLEKLLPSIDMHERFERALRDRLRLLPRCLRISLLATRSSRSPSS